MRKGRESSYDTLATILGRSDEGLNNGCNRKNEREATENIHWTR
jgi:hypothetical protein